MNKRILITGANGGLGKESARQLSKINGIEKIIEMDLSDTEKEMFKKSIASVRKTADEVIALTS